MRSTEGTGAPAYSLDCMPWKFKGCSKQIMDQTCRLSGQFCDGEMTKRLYLFLLYSFLHYSGEVQLACNKNTKECQVNLAGKGCYAVSSFILKDQNLCLP